MMFSQMPRYMDGSYLAEASKQQKAFVQTEWHT